MLKKLKFILTKSEKIRLIFLALGSILLSLSEVLSIGILIPIIWLFVNPEKIHNSLILNKLYLSSGAKDDNSFLAVLALCAIILFFLKTIYSIFMLFCQQNFIMKVYNRLTSNVLDYYLNKEYAFHLANNSSVLFKNMSAEVSQFTSYFLTPIIAISSECIIIFGMIIFLCFSYPVVAASLFFISGGLLTATNFILKKKIKSYATGRNIYSDQFYKFSLEALHAVKEIQVFNVQKTFVDRLEKIIKKYNDNLIKFNVASSLPRYILEVVFFISILITIIISVYTNKDYKEIIPMMAIIGVVALRLLPSISRITANINAFHFSFNSTDIVYDIVKGYKINGENPDSLVRVGLNDADTKSLCARNITFSYAADKNTIFKDFSLIVPLNKTTALIGETGSGKSTLIDIIMGLLTPLKGDIYYGETRIGPENILAYRKKIGYVPQNIFLFDDTICSNIALGVPKEKIDYEMLDYVIKITQLESFINNLPEGINSQIGERGVRISGGQRQRIGIARALYRNPEILIFDEATSALDVHTETKLYNAVRPLGKTIIVVTHRLSTIENADIIYVLEQGNIIERGTFEELAEKSVFFKKIAKEKQTPILENGTFFNGNSQCKNG